MTEITLLSSTGSAPIDRLLRGIIATIEQQTAGRVRGYYLVGSYAVGEAVPTSDIDLIVLYKDELSEPERAQFATVREQCRAQTPHALDLNAESEARLFRVGGVWFQTASLLLYGADVRSAVPRKPVRAHIRDSMHALLPLLARVRGTPPALAFPLSYPDPADEFYGYTQRLIRAPDGSYQPCSKNLVLNIGGAAGALALLASGRYEGSGRKSASAPLYRRHINDGWSALVEQVFALCRSRWSYLIPSDPAERRQLRALAEQALGFENHFLERYRAFLLEQLADPDPLARRAALRRLSQLRYPDASTLRAAIERAAGPDDAETLELAALAQQRYREQTGQTGGARSSL